MELLRKQSMNYLLFKKWKTNYLKVRLPGNDMIGKFSDFLL